ncbi:MAG: helix-turn-helix transcriptional regulator [Clostridia bacterium]|nr:helix-turn-helix transcriptional regulator [Clostridia bacterium]
MATITNQIGQRIRQARSKLGLTQEQLGERANLHYSYIGQVERGTKTPSVQTLDRIAKALNTGLEYILEEREDYVPSLDNLLEKELLNLISDRNPADVELIINITRNVLKRIDEVKE